MDGTDKKLEAMVLRVRKHLGGGSLFGVAWGAVKEQLLARCVACGSLCCSVVVDRWT
jgi:hypothetical protein